MTILSGLVTQPALHITVQLTWTMEKKKKTKPCTVSSVAKSTSRSILACCLAQSINMCNMCTGGGGEGNKAILEVIWVESVMVHWHRYLLVIRGKTLTWVNDSKRTSSRQQKQDWIDRHALVTKNLACCCFLHSGVLFCNQKISPTHATYG